MNTRRHFLKKVGVGSAALVALPVLGGTLTHADAVDRSSAGNSMTLSGDKSLPLGSWALNYEGRVSELVLSKDAGGNLTGTLSGRPISPAWNSGDQTITFVAKFDPSRQAELQVFTGLFFEKSGPTERYIAGWAESSNGDSGTDHKRIARWHAR
jgi:hypothetical protein